MKRVILATIFAIGLLMGGWLTLPRVNAAGSPNSNYCSATYIVQRGDTLSSIATRAGTNIWYLAEINHLYNVNHIYVGQVLCLPNPIEANTPTNANFDLVVEHTFDLSGDDPEQPRTWLMGRNRVAGKRLSYPLTTLNALKTYSDSTYLVEASLNNATSPIVWLARIDEDTTQYTLIAIGNPKPLLDLQMAMTPTQFITQIIPIEDTGKGTSVNNLSLDGNQVSLQAELTSTDGTFVPIAIDKIDYFQDIEDAESFYGNNLGFALHPTANPDTQGYQLLVRVQSGLVGPQGEYIQETCSNWQGSGIWDSIRSSIFGCSRGGGYSSPYYGGYRPYYQPYYGGYQPYYYGGGYQPYYQPYGGYQPYYQPYYGGYQPYYRGGYGGF